MVSKGPKMTNMYDERFSRLQADTYPGMAHWGGTGPANKRCMECRYFKASGSNQGYLSTGELASGRCGKYSEMMTNPFGKKKLRGPTFPYFALACRYFEESKNPYTQFLKDRRNG